MVRITEVSVPKIPAEWYYRRFQAVGRAQSRYLFLLLTILAYSVGLNIGPGDAVSVGFLGLESLPKNIVNAATILSLESLSPTWLRPAYRIDGVLLFLLIYPTAVFWVRRWEIFQDPKSR